MVEFHQYNLTDDKLPTGVSSGTIDVIFCRNVLMYFHPDQIDKVLIKLESLLAPDSLLAVNPIELLCIPERMFERLKHPGAAMLRKRKPWAPVDMSAEEPPLWRSQMSAPTPSRTSDIDFSFTGATFLPTPTLNVPPPVQLPEIHVTAARDEVSVEHDPDMTREAQRYFDEGRYRDCVEHLLKVAGHRNAEPARVKLLAHAYSNDGDLAAALAWTDKAIDHDKLSHALYYFRATILQSLGNIPDAISSLRQALFLEPEFVVAEFNSGKPSLSVRQKCRSKQAFPQCIDASQTI